MATKQIPPRLHLFKSLLKTTTEQAFVAIYKEQEGDWNKIAAQISADPLPGGQGAQRGANKSSIVTSLSTSPMLCSFLRKPKGVTIVRKACLEDFQLFLSTDKRLWHGQNNYCVRNVG